eukprot:1137156-Pelagomonas_calceolata.AAC.2
MPGYRTHLIILVLTALRQCLALQHTPQCRVNSPPSMPCYRTHLIILVPTALHQCLDPLRHLRAMTYTHRVLNAGTDEQNVHGSKDSVPSALHHSP